MQKSPAYYYQRNGLNNLLISLLIAEGGKLVIARVKVKAVPNVTWEQWQPITFSGFDGEGQMARFLL